MLPASLSLRWLQGFPKQNIDFINNNTICYPCGNYIIFINVENGKRTFLPCKQGKVGAMKTYSPFQVVAFSDRRLKPSIYIFNFPELTRKVKLKGHAQLDYTLLEFSYCGTYLASYSAVPEYELTLWNWEGNVILCSKSQPGVEVSQMTFNPMTWTQMCLSSASALTIWNIEKCDKNYHLKPKPVNLPEEDGTSTYETDGMFSYSEFKDNIYGSTLIISSIAGLVGVEVETFKPKDDMHPLLHPTVHCWNATNEIYVGCEEGHILLINGENLFVTILTRVAEVSQEIHSSDTSVNTMALHKEGLFVAGNDGIVHSFVIKETNYTVKDHFDVQEPVGNVIFSPNYQLLLIVTIKGSIYTYTFGKESKIKTILDASASNIQAIDFITPGNKYCVSITMLGEFYIWSLEDGSHVSKLHLRTEVNALACCPSSHSVVVGTNAGYIQFIDVTNIEFPQVVHKVFLTHSSIQHLCYDQKGDYLIIGTSNGYIFFLNARPSQSFRVLGFTEVSDNIMQISIVSNPEMHTMEIMALLGTSKSETSKVEILTLYEANLTDPDICSDERGRLKNNIIKRQLYEINHPLTSAIFDFFGFEFYGFCGHVPYICSYDIPQKDNKTVVLEPKIKMQSKHFGTGKLYLSAHGKWLASIAKDGILSIRHAESLETFAQIQSHSYQGQGIQSMAFSFDGHFILVNGREDGTLVCLAWKKLTVPLVREAVGHFNSLINFLKSIIAKEKLFLSDMRERELVLDSVSEQSVEAIYKAKTNIMFSQDEYSGVSDGINEQEITWLEKKNNEAMRKEIKEFSEKKKELKQAIKVLVKTVEELMKENDLASEIAQLELQEFSLDVEEMRKLHDVNEKEVEKIRKEAEMENLAKKFLWNILKEECWDSMNIKGQGLKAFHIPLEVKNFPMKTRTPEELEELNSVLQMKNFQAIDLKLQKEIVDLHLTESMTSKPLEEEEEEEEEVVKVEENIAFNLLGSLFLNFGIQVGLLNSQLDLYTRDEKINQIILLKDIIYKVKTIFNNEFNAAFQQKKLEITRVKEKNVRIREIVRDLQLGEEVWEPNIEACEKPAAVLKVKDHEIKCEKYLTPWEREQAEKAAALELERQLLAERDNDRRRGLMDMMHGVLEIKKEDILKMEIPLPEFAKTKIDAIWTEDEKKLFKEYEKKVKELSDEKEKYKKSLDAELKKIQGSIQEATQTFDDNLRKLFDRKVEADMVVYQEELQIINLIFSLLLDEELNTRELGLNNFLERKQAEKKRTAKDVFRAREEVDAFRESYDNLVAEDKVVDRGFKKELAELASQHVEILHKLFRRRPRMPRHRAPAESNSPFSTRLESERLKKDNFSKIMEAMDDLDKPENMPEGLELSAWKYFCAARRTKVENEHKVKQKAAGLLEIQAFLQKRIEDDEKVQTDIDKIFQEIYTLQRDKTNHQTDLTIQIILKQGQVEAENFHFMLEFTDCVLVSRNIIEELNNIIRIQGQKKIASMMENKKYHKGIIQIDWEHKKMVMEMEDLNQKAWDIQQLFFSKAHQAYLKEHDYDFMIGMQTSLMEQTIAGLDKKHKRDVETYTQLFKKLKKTVSQKDTANYILSCNLHEELVCITERKYICHKIGTKLTWETIAKERYEALLQQQKLVDISKEQYEQISILQAEVERLRMKTFPALIQM
ncbi:cilia- and flagella-associated protein 43-like [Gracilinanus agilis]|uniref:cilia- and flagella-associated protein 43-like n=1 Tax=Gracilinanus agilis TaxID=191870 RepID=UPI001CFE55FA|nr:cilia- and flagella-associated protein 43-like [Gracilinanus agilis]